MVRLRSYDADEALDKAKAVFWAKGYDASTIGDLAEATGLGTGSLYNAFGDKHSLYLKSLDRYGKKEVAAAIGWIERQDCRGAEAVAGFLKTIAAQVESGAYSNGCFLCNAAIDQAPHDPAIAARVSANMGSAAPGIPRTVEERPAHGGGSRSPRRFRAGELSGHVRHDPRRRRRRHGPPRRIGRQRRAQRLRDAAAPSGGAPGKRRL